MVGAYINHSVILMYFGKKNSALNFAVPLVARDVYTTKLFFAKFSRAFN